MSDPRSSLERIKFEGNPEPRCPVVLLLDTSSSMGGEPIQQLNDGLRLFEQEVKNSPEASVRVELAVVPFGGGPRVVDGASGGAQTLEWNAAKAFVTAGDFQAPSFTAMGDTPMGEAARRAVSLLTDVKAIYKRNGIDYYRPWVVLITDGQPTDDGWREAARMLRTEESRRGVTVFGIGVDQANMAQLGEFCTRQPLRLRGLAFREFVLWLSNSLKSTSQKRAGEQIALPAPSDWAAVDTSTR